MFRNPTVALRAVLVAQDAVKSLEVQGYTPRMRIGIHTGRPRKPTGIPPDLAIYRIKTVSESTAADNFDEMSPDAQ